jgi:hypothetical protein
VRIGVARQPSSYAPSCFFSGTGARVHCAGAASGPPCGPCVCRPPAGRTLLRVGRVHGRARRRGLARGRGRRIAVVSARAAHRAAAPSHRNRRPPAARTRRIPFRRTAASSMWRPRVQRRHPCSCSRTAGVSTPAPGIASGGSCGPTSACCSGTCRDWAGRRPSAMVRTTSSGLRRTCTC